MLSELETDILERREEFLRKGRTQELHDSMKRENDDLRRRLRAEELKVKVLVWIACAAPIASVAIWAGVWGR